MAKSRKSNRKKYIMAFSVVAVFLFVFTFINFLSQYQNNSQYQNDNQQVLQAAGASVSIIDFQFSPASITVPAGTTVTWTNMSASGAMHTTSSDAQGTANSWDSGLTQKGQTFSHTFTTPGTYTYHCNVHTFMRGTVVVTAAGTAPTATTAPVAPTATLAPVATSVPPTAAPTAITPTLVCVGGNGTPPCATIPPTMPGPTNVGNPTIAPTAPVSVAPPPGTGGNQNITQLLLQFIMLLLQLLQSLFGGGHGHA